MTAPTGELLLHGTAVRGGGHAFQAESPLQPGPLPTTFHSASAADVAHAVHLAAAAAPAMAATTPTQRATLLRRIGEAILELGDELLARAQLETALPLPRLTGERARTVQQLGLFASLLEDGSYVDARIDRPDRQRQPPKPDLRSMLVPLGPIAVFGASNFPLAFSVAGGDTASALAAGCPCVVKAHPAHPGTSELVGRAIQQAIAATGMPPAAFGLLQGDQHEVGQSLVQAEGIRAAGFTGSLLGGRALFALASARATPIPLFAEMGSANPVVVLPETAADDAEKLALQLADSALLACGQFCTSPGIVLLPAAADAFAAAMTRRFAAAPAAPMVHQSLARSFRGAFASVLATGGVEVLTAVPPSEQPAFASPALLQVTVATFLGNARLRHELYGPLVLLVHYQDAADLRRALAALDGHLTGSVHGTAADLQQHRQLIDLLAQKVGRLLFGGVPTGVEVGHAMQHGGPWPASTDARFTSVGAAAIRRWLRPLCFQDAPQELLPEELRDGNPRGILRTIDGVAGRN